MISRAALLAPFILAAACGSAEEEAEVPNLPPEELADTLERVHVARKEGKPKKAAPVLGFLREEDLAPDWRARPSCRLGREGRIILVALAEGAIARIDGRPVRLGIAGPVGPSGGFFEGEGHTVSIGRRTPVAPRADALPVARRASVTVGGAKDAPLGKTEALWLCGG